MSRTNKAQTFQEPNLTGTVKINGTALTATADELNAIAGGGLSAAELGYLDGVVAGTATASKALVVGADKNVDTLAIAASGLKIGSGAGTAVTASAAELNMLAAVVAGTAAASKAAVLGTNKNLDEFHTAALYVGAAAGTLVTATAAELNKLAGSGAAVASGTQAAHLADASAAHDLNATFSDTEAESALNALATKINSIIDALEAYGIMAAS